MVCIVCMATFLHRPAISDLPHLTGHGSDLFFSVGISIDRLGHLQGFNDPAPTLQQKPFTIINQKRSKNIRTSQGVLLKRIKTISKPTNGPKPKNTLPPQGLDSRHAPQELHEPEPFSWLQSQLPPLPQLLLPARPTPIGKSANPTHLICLVDLGFLQLVSQSPPQLHKIWQCLLRRQRLFGAFLFLLRTYHLCTKFKKSICWTDRQMWKNSDRFKMEVTSHNFNGRNQTFISCENWWYYIQYIIIYHVNIP